MPSSCGIDLQHRPGGRAGSGGIASQADLNRDRRERLRKLALETIDLNKDPYFMKNHLGQYECRLCLTLHTNEGSYLTHTQAKKHQTNLAKRAYEQNKISHTGPVMAPGAITPKIMYKKFVKIGRPGYKVTKQLTKVAYGGARQQSLLFQIDYPEIGEGIVPRHRFMSSYEQRVEAPNRKYQYLLFAAEPYETISFKIPARDIDRSTDEKFWTYWNSTTKQFFMQFHFRIDRRGPKDKEKEDEIEIKRQKEEMKKMPLGTKENIEQKK